MFVFAGDIFVMELLDYEESSQHYLTVKATAGGKQSLSDMATVTIHLLDINDNSPVFSQKIYSAIVSEDTRLASTVLTVSVFCIYLHLVMPYLLSGL